MIKIINATSKGYIEIIEGGVLNIAFPESETRRGRVIADGRICPTLDTGCEVGVIIVEEIKGNNEEQTASREGI